jgi:glycosyltransferase involved in cell wall biosynthesis
MLALGICLCGLSCDLARRALSWLCAPLLPRWKGRELGCTVRVVVYPERDPNPFVRILKDGLASQGCEVVSWRERPDPATVDVFLPQWPELQWYTQHKSTPARVVAATRRSSIEFYCSAVRKHGGHVCWLAHDRMPHPASAAGVTHDEWLALCAPLHRLFDSVVHLTRASLVDAAFSHLSHLPQAVIPHPHYPLVDPDSVPREPIPLRRFVFINGTDPRKEAAPAITRLAELGRDVVITGTEGQSKEIDVLVRRNPNLRLIPAGMSDTELRELLTPGSAAVLSQRLLLNSGVMFLALSRGVPVLCPDNPVNREIAAGLDDGWVRTYSDVEGLRECLHAAPGGVPNLSGRDPRLFSRELVTFLHGVTAQGA